MKVLIADDCSMTLEILQKSLKRWGYEPMLVSDGEQALRVLRSPAGPRLALLDWSMPKLEGTAVCRELRTRIENALTYTYVIMLTARDGEENVVEALEAGADDYLIKPVSTKELQLRMRAGERIVQLQDRVVSVNRRLALMTTYDQLTGVLNRASVMERLTHEIERAARNSGSLAYLTLSIDEFDNISEQLGMNVADKLLKEVAHRIRNAVRSYDVVGRLGGEDFAVVLAECDLGIGMGMSERLRGCIADRPFLVGEDVIEVTCSVGVSSTSSEGPDRRQLVNGAEKSLRQAKSEGGNRSLMWETGQVLNPLRSESKPVEPATTS